jgi:hypothetical protein
MLPRRRARSMTFSAAVVTAMFFGFVIVYMVWNAYAVFQPTIGTTVVRLENAQMQTSVPGLIVRYETLIYAPREGRVAFTVADFERVREGDVVAAVQDVEALQRSEQSLSEMETQIMEMGELRDATRTDPAITHLNTNLRNMMDRSIQHFSTGNLSAIYSLVDSATQITQTRNRRIIDENRYIVSEWERQHTTLLDQQLINSVNVSAPAGGIVSPFLDGQETVFLPAYMGTITQDQVHRVFDHTAIIPVRDTYEDEPIMKIVGNNWYIVAFISNEAARGQGFQTGTDRVIYLENVISNEFMAVPVRVYRVQDGPRYIQVTFRATRNVVEFLHQRNVNIRTTSSVQSGFFIPAEAVAARHFFRIPHSHVHGGANPFVLHRTDTVNTVHIHVARTSATHVYVLDENQILARGDALIPVNVLENEYIITDASVTIVHGIYRVVMGSTDFLEIFFDDTQIEADGVILLSPAQNPTLRQFDVIVTDATGVRQGQIIG